MVPVRTAVLVRAVVRKQIADAFGSPAVPSGRAIRGFWCPASGGFAGCWV